MGIQKTEKSRYLFLRWFMVYLLALLVIAGKAPAGHVFAESISDCSYYNPLTDTVEKIDATVMDTSSTTLTTGWYVVKDTFEITGRIKISGDVNIILADGCMLTDNNGITVDSADKLTIWGQRAGTGNLYIDLSGNNNNRQAGIGGSSGSGLITINGGIIYSRGGNHSAGIGGGNGGGTSYIIINGGDVTAESGGRGAGIGGGLYGSAEVTITGGTVTATGKNNGCGIGGGSTTKSGSPTGSGSAKVTITGGKIEATGEYGGAGIGGNESEIVISGGNVTATGGDSGDDIGKSYGGTGTGTFSTGENGNAVIHTTHGLISDTSGQAEWDCVADNMVYGDVVLDEDFTIGEGEILTIPKGSSLTLAEGKTLTNNGTLQNKGTITGEITNHGRLIQNGEIKGTGLVDDDGTVEYEEISLIGGFTVIDGIMGEDFKYEDNVLTILKNKPLTISGETTEDTILVQDGVKANLTFDGLNIDVSSKYEVCAVRVEGAAELTLTLKGENFLNSGYYQAGLEVDKSASLTITEESTGSLKAAADGDAGAGIGGGSNEDSGTITINGGTITAESEWGAGIGSGRYGTCSGITINGGTITAESEYGAGIGSGQHGTCSGITINGGTITAKSNTGVEIGGDELRNCGKLTFGEKAEYTISKSIVGTQVTNYGSLTNNGEINGNFDNYNQYISSVGMITGQVRTTVSVYRNRNGAAWNESGYNCTLKTASEGTVEFDEQSSEPLVKMGTYNIYENGTDTDRTVEVGYNPVELTLDYYTVDFCDGKDGSTLTLPEQQTVLGGKTVSKPDLIEEPSKTGYEFTGWSSRPNETEGDNSLFPLEIKEKTNVYACWKAIEYKISYNLGDGTNDSSNPTTYTIEDEISLNEPTSTREGYEFEGWTYERGGKKTESPEKKLTLPSGETGEITFTAHWKATEYTIKYELGGGTNDSGNPSTYTIEDEISLNEPISTREGYEFEGWTYERGGKKTESPEKELILSSGGTGDITFTAHWKATEYKINYELDGGTNNAGNPATYTVEKPIELKAPEKNGYEFEGWTYVRGDEKGEMPEKELTLSSRGTGDITFTAHWKVIEYKISYNLGDGMNDIDNPSTYTIENEIRLNAPTSTREGYEFEGWTYERNGEKIKDLGKELTLPAGGTGDITFTAHWKAIPPQPTTEESTEKPTEKPTEQTTESKTEQIADMPPAAPVSVPKKVTAREKKENSSTMSRKADAGWKGKGLSIKWGKVEDAEGYDIFVTQCGKSLDQDTLVKTVKGQASSVELARISGKKLSDEKNYKIKVKAYRQINGTKVYIGSSKTYHVAGKENKLYTNAKKIKVSRKKYTLKTGRTANLQAKIVKESPKKELLPKAHGAALEYESTDEKVATVTAKGKIKAKGTGTCYIYITALNGVQAKVTVKVK